MKQKYILYIFAATLLIFSGCQITKNAPEQIEQAQTDSYIIDELLQNISIKNEVLSVEEVIKVRPIEDESTFTRMFSKQDTIELTSNQEINEENEIIFDKEETEKTINLSYNTAISSIPLPQKQQGRIKNYRATITSADSSIENISVTSNSEKISITKTKKEILITGKNISKEENITLELTY